jgi:hypothetical protein
MNTFEIPTYLIAGVIAYWLICGIGAAAIADSKGRSAGAWFFYGILCGPLGIMIVGFMEKESQPVVQGYKAAPGIPSSDANRVKCPTCAELILREAKVCHFCGQEITHPKPVELAPLEIAEGKLREAHKLLGMGKPKEALESYLAITREYPNCLPAWKCIVTTANADEQTRDLARQNIARLTV